MFRSQYGVKRNSTSPMFFPLLQGTIYFCISICLGGEKPLRSEESLCKQWVSKGKNVEITELGLK